MWTEIQPTLRSPMACMPSSWLLPEWEAQRHGTGSDSASQTRYPSGIACGASAHDQDTAQAKCDTFHNCIVTS